MKEIDFPLTLKLFKKKFSGIKLLWGFEFFIIISIVINIVSARAKCTKQNFLLFYFVVKKCIDEKC